MSNVDAAGKQNKSNNILTETIKDDGASRKSRFFHPYLQLLISIILTAASQIFLKIGVDTQLSAKSHPPNRSGPVGSHLRGDRPL
jgi:hypothetical protein